MHGRPHAWKAAAYTAGVRRPATLPAAPLRRRLLAWFDRAKRRLPWRFPEGEADAYRVWVSEVMLQQTQVATVIPYFQRFVARFPTLEALAAAGEDEVLGLWSGLGYYARGRALLRAAREAQERYGALPRTVEGLRTLPGFGPYTAGAVASIAFGERAPAVDGNATRVLARLCRIGGDSASPRFRARVWKEAGRLVGAGGRPGDFNQALIELGALVCRPSGPDCDRCPVAGWCGARGAGMEKSFPRAKRAGGVKEVSLVTAVCRREGRVLLVRRPAEGLYGGMWTPLTFELAAGVDPLRAISAAISREPSRSTGGIVYCGQVVRALTHRRLVLPVYCVKLERTPALGSGRRMASSAELEALGIPEAFRAALALAEAPSPISGGLSRAAKEGGLAAEKKTSRLRPLAAMDVQVEGRPEPGRRKKIKRIRESA
jgi:A/G-specific adenine glycosylase